MSDTKEQCLTLCAILISRQNFEPQAYISLSTEQMSGITPLLEQVKIAN